MASALMTGCFSPLCYFQPYLSVILLKNTFLCADCLSSAVRMWHVDIPPTSCPDKCLINAWSTFLNSVVLNGEASDVRGVFFAPRLAFSVNCRGLCASAAVEWGQKPFTTAQGGCCIDTYSVSWKQYAVSTKHYHSASHPSSKKVNYLFSLFYSWISRSTERWRELEENRQ